LRRARGKAERGGKAVANRIDKLMLPLWYMKLTYPDVYRLPESDAPALWRETKRVMLANRITHVNEAGISATGWIAEMDARFAPLPKNVVYDLLRIGEVRLENCADWRLATVTRDGQLLRTVFQHPRDEKDADATYEIKLPAIQDGKKLTLSFGTVITAATDDGVRFSVLVDGKELWNKTRTSYLGQEEASKSAYDNIMPRENPFADHSVDLSTYADQTVKLTLRVNAIRSSRSDWANWIQPRIVME
jgi:hypothetical protein